MREEEKRVIECAMKVKTARENFFRCKESALYRVELRHAEKELDYAVRDLVKADSQAPIMALPENGKGAETPVEIPSGNPEGTVAVEYESMPMEWRDAHLEMLRGRINSGEIKPCWLDGSVVMPEDVMGWKRCEDVVPTELVTSTVPVMDENTKKIYIDYRLMQPDGWVWKSRRRWRWWMPVAAMWNIRKMTGGVRWGKLEVVSGND